MPQHMWRYERQKIMIKVVYKSNYSRDIISLSSVSGDPINQV